MRIYLGRKIIPVLVTALFVSITPSRAADGPDNAVANAAQAAPVFGGSSNLVVDADALGAWNDTNLYRKIPKVDFDMPVPDTIRALKDLYTNSFDVILPIDPDPGAIFVRIELRNVNALEIFNAMNIAFEIDASPAHWKLILNGERPTAILEIKKPHVAEILAPRQVHSVFSIENLLDIPESMGDEEFRRKERDKTAVFVEDQICQVLKDVQKAEDPRDQIHLHEGAALLVFNGTQDQTDLVRSALEALRYTVETERSHQVNEHVRAVTGALKK